MDEVMARSLLSAPKPVEDKCPDGTEEEPDSSEKRYDSGQVSDMPVRQ
jgi:hypothetical protein